MGENSETTSQCAGVRVSLTRTQRECLLLLQKGYLLEVEKRGPGYVSHLGGAEIGGRGIRFDAAQRMVHQSLVEKLSEDERVTRYRISPTAIQILEGRR